MTGEEIIEVFRTLVDDELGDIDDVKLLNLAYRTVLNMKSWEFLRKEYSGTINSGDDYIALPSGFAYIPLDGAKLYPIVYLGTDVSEYSVIPYSKKRTYRDSKWFFYVDLVNDKLMATEPMDETLAIEFDYIYIPADLTLTTSPVFWSDFHQGLAYVMVLLFNMADQEEKSRGYSVEAEVKGMDWFNQMAMRDARLKTAL